MKKTILLFLLLALTLALFSCAKQDVTENNPSDSTAENADTMNYDDNGTTSAENAESAAEETQAEAPVAENEFIPVLRFISCSDTHMNTSESRETERFKLMFETAYRYSDSHPYYNSLDAVVISGDMTNNGYREELAAVKRRAEKYLRDGTEFITVMGNHETYGGNPQIYSEVMETTPNKHVVIKGYHFIGISPDDNSNEYSEKTAEWLKNELAAAAEDAPNQPIFSFRHHHLKNTVYVSRSWFTNSTSRLRKVYDEYPQIIDFSGDSHGPQNNPLSIWQDKFTMLNTGTLSYFEMETGMTGGTLPEGKENAAQYYIVEVSADNIVKIQPFNILTDDFFKTPSNTDDPDKQLVYYIDVPKGVDGFTYTESRGDTAASPYFKDDAKITVSDISYDKATFTVPQAYDDSCIYSYTLEIYDGNKKVKTCKYFSEYYFEPLPETVSYSLAGLEGGTEYSAKIYPVNAWGKTGEPIETTFTTKELVLTPYESVNPVTFRGTFTDFESLTSLSRSKDSYAYGGDIGGDVYGGQWDGNSSSSDVKIDLAKGKGYNGSTALGVAMCASNHANRAIYIFATDDNRFTTQYDENKYLRVWVDFTGIDFRKASFGLVTKSGELYSTDDFDGQSNQKIYCLADGSDTWTSMTHGGDGCFGAAQDSSVEDFKGWLAFPTADFGARNGSGVAYSGYEISGVYMYFDYVDDSMTGTEFYLDEISLVNDYKTFTEYTK